MKVTSEKIEKGGFKPTRIVIDIETEQEADALIYLLWGGTNATMTRAPLGIILECRGVPITPIIEALEKAKHS